MDSIAIASTKLKWSEETITVNEIEEKFGFPQVVKTCAKTSNDYKLPEDEVICLLSRRSPVRMIAHTIEEGDYVMGKQLEIPSEYNGLFKMNNDFEREYIPLMTFRSIQEVADAHPPKVYVQKRLIINPTDIESAAKGPMVLEKGDELALITKLEPQYNQYTKQASKLLNRVLRPQQHYLMVHCQRSNESLRLPYSVQGWFATRPPSLVYLTEKRGVISLQQIMEKINFPTNVTVTTNSTRSSKDEFLLRTGMHLKLLGLEEHDIVLGVTLSQQIVEFSTKNVAFKLPFILSSTSSMENDTEKTAQINQYQSCLLSLYMHSKLLNSPTNIDEYCTSVRFHVPRNVRATDPLPLNCNASLRSLVLSPSNQRKRMNVGDSTRGLSAAQRLHNPHQEEGLLDAPHSNGREIQARHSIDRPEYPTPNPPLPPRNIKLPKSVPYSNREVPSPPRSSPTQSSPLHNVAIPTVESPSMSRKQTLDYARDDKPIQQTATVDDETESIWVTFIPKSEAPLPHPIQETVHSESEEHPPNPASNDFVARSDIDPFNPASLQEDGRLTTNGDPARSAFHDYATSDSKDSWSFKDIYANAEDVEDPSHTAPARANQVLREVNAAMAAESAIKLATGHSSEPERVADVSSNILHQKSSQQGIGAKSYAGEDELEATQPCHVPVKSYASPPKLWCPPGDVHSLTVEETAASLRYIGLSEDVVTMFGNERIDGTILAELTDSILEEDFHLNKLYRFKIKRFIQGWRPKLPQLKRA